MKYEDYLAQARADWPDESESFIRMIADQELVSNARRKASKAHSRCVKPHFYVEVPQETKTVNINININESSCDDCVCQQILIRMMNGKEYWL